MRRIRDMPRRYKVELIRLIGTMFLFCAAYVFIARLA